MGDPIRFAVMAEWVMQNFPRCKSVLDVAGGSGVLSAYLAALGYDVTLVDPKGRLNPIARQIARKSGRAPRILRKPFGPDAPPSDLILGMHPDEATIEIVRQADARMCYFAVVPCCIKTSGGALPLHFAVVRKNSENWIQYLAHLPKNLDTRTSKLRMAGKNRIVWGWPKQPEEA